MRWVWGSIGAYWLADIINPGFFSVAVMALCMIPILILDIYFPPEPPPPPVKVEADSQEDVDASNS